MKPRGRCASSDRDSRRSCSASMLPRTRAGRCLMFHVKRNHLPPSSHAGTSPVLPWIPLISLDAPLCSVIPLHGGCSASRIADTPLPCRCAPDTPLAVGPENSAVLPEPPRASSLTGFRSRPGSTTAANQNLRPPLQGESTRGPQRSDKMALGLSQRGVSRETSWRGGVEVLPPVIVRRAH